MAKPYKLKKEIEQFIVNAKKVNPGISCRTLVGTIKEKFGLEISKSSINVIIKSNLLSGKTGRPRIRNRPEKNDPGGEVLVQQPNEVAPRIMSDQPVQKPESLVFRGSERNEPVFEARDYPVSFPESPKKEEVEPAAPVPPGIEIRSVEERISNIENGGAIFLLMADYKLAFSRFLAQRVSSYLEDCPEDALMALLQVNIYGQIVKNEMSLAGLLGKELICPDLSYYSDKLGKLPFNKLNEDLAGLGLSRNISDMNELCQKSLLFLNKQAQLSFFPSVYQFLEFAAMRERFYSLAARIERTGSLFSVQFLCPPRFSFVTDIVWQDDFRWAINNINKERVFTPEGNLYRFEEHLAACQF